MYNSKLYWTLPYLSFTINGCISISALASLLGIPIGIKGFAIALKICPIAAGINKYKSIIKKTRKDKIVLLAKFKLNGIEVLISKALIDSNISHDKFVLVNNVEKDYDDMKEKIKNSIKK